MADQRRSYLRHLRRGVAAVSSTAADLVARRRAARALPPRPRAVPLVAGADRRDGRRRRRSRHFRNELADIDGLSLIPPELLHISVRGVGFQVIAKPDSRTTCCAQDVGGIGERAAKALRGVKPIDVDRRPGERLPRRPHPRGRADRADARPPARARRGCRRPRRLSLSASRTTSRTSRSPPSCDRDVVPTPSASGCPRSARSAPVADDDPPHRLRALVVHRPRSRRRGPSSTPSARYRAEVAGAAA